MADDTKIFSKDKPVDYGKMKADLDGMYERQLDIEKSLVKQANTLMDSFGLQKDISTTIMEQFKRTQKLNKLIQEDILKETELRKQMASAEDETKARELKQSIESIIQRRAGYAAELELLEKMRINGFMPILLIALETYKLFKLFDAAAWEFRKAMGMTRRESEGVRTMTQRIAVDFMHVGVSIESAYVAVLALRKEMGSVFTVTAELVKTTAILKSQLGVSEEFTAGFLRNMAAVSQSSMESQTNMAYMASYMSQMAGIPLNDVMNDIGKASGNTLTMMSRMPNQILRTAIELRRMGSSLKDAANSSRGLLDFQESVNAEMEASVLLGRGINLQHARELAYKRNLEGSTKAILNLTKQIGFEGLDVFQQEAFARATGRSVDELLKMVQVDREWRKARSSSDPALRKMVENYDNMRKMSKASLMSETERLKLMIQEKGNQERLVAIQAKWNQLVAKIAERFLPLVDKTLGFVVDHFDDIVKAAAIWVTISSRIASEMLQMWRVSKQVTLALMSAGRYGVTALSPIQKLVFYIHKVGASIFAIGSSIGKFAGSFGFISKFMGVFSKLLGPIGWVIMAVQGISGAIDGWSSATGDWTEKLKGAIVGLWRGIIPGFGWIEKTFPKLVKGASDIAVFLYTWANPIAFVVRMVMGLINIFSDGGEAFKKMVVGMWNTLKDWLGFSPSAIGLSIVKGITSVGSMLFTALTDPFRRAFEWIMSKLEKLPGMGDIVAKMRIGANVVFGDSMEKRAATNNVSTITPETTAIVAAAAKPTPAAGKAAEAESTSNDRLLTNILDAINMLNKNLESGKIGIYMDGQLLSATLSRGTEFSRGYGSNRV